MHGDEQLQRLPWPRNPLLVSLMSNLFERIELRRRNSLLTSVLKKQGQGADEKTQAAIACILDHEECFEAFAAGVESEYADRPVPFFGPGFGNRLTDFLDWIIANWDSILAMVMTIIDLFSAKPQPQE